MGFSSRSNIVEIDGLGAKLASWLEGSYKIHDDYMRKEFPKNLEIFRTELEVRPGERYIKVFINEFARKTDEYVSGSIFAFIDRINGDVLKPAGTKAPAKKARGNLFDEHNGLKCIGPHGVLTAR